jgi:hypothetical protein
LGEEEATAKGDIGGVGVAGNGKDDDPRANGLKVVIAEPVEAYTGRKSSGLCAKKQTFRAQPVSSLQSRVRYWAG